MNLRNRIVIDPNTFERVLRNPKTGEKFYLDCFTPNSIEFGSEQEALWNVCRQIEKERNVHRRKADRQR